MYTHVKKYFVEYELDIHTLNTQKWMTMKKGSISLLDNQGE